MDEIIKMIAQIGGQISPKCNWYLCEAIAVAKDSIPDEPPMNVISQKVWKRTDAKSSGAVSRALCRAVKVLWQTGNPNEFQKVYGANLSEKPAPRTFIYRAALSSGQRVYYQVCLTKENGKYVILGYSKNKKNRIFSKPTDSSLQTLKQLVTYLNDKQIPLELFESLSDINLF